MSQFNIKTSTFGNHYVVVTGVRCCVQNVSFGKNGDVINTKNCVHKVHREYWGDPLSTRSINYPERKQVMVLNGFCVFKLDTMQAKIYVIKVKKYPANAETVYDATGLNINTRYTWEKLIKVAWMLI